MQDKESIFFGSFENYLQQCYTQKVIAKLANFQMPIFRKSIKIQIFSLIREKLLAGGIK